jgi:hypothetical protein
MSTTNTPAASPQPEEPSQAAPPSATPAAPQSVERPLLSLHAFTVLLGAAAIGAVAGLLAHAQSHSLTGAVIAGGGAFAASVYGLHKLIG